MNKRNLARWTASGITGAFAAMAAMTAATPAAAQGVVDRLGRAIDKADRASSDTEQKLDQAEQTAQRGKRLINRLGGDQTPRRARDAEAAVFADEPWPDQGSEAADIDDADLPAAPPPPSLKLFTKTHYQGYAAEIESDAPSWHVPAISMGYKVYSLVAVGKWEVCRNPNYRGGCHIVEGEYPTLGELRGALSSARIVREAEGE